MRKKVLLVDDHPAMLWALKNMLAQQVHFEIIGEALNQLSKLDTAMAARIPDLAQIVAFRNQLIHGYATVNVSTVWSITQTALPALRGGVQGQPHSSSTTTKAILIEKVGDEYRQTFRGEAPTAEQGLYEARNGGLRAFAAVGPLNPREAAALAATG